ncbi:methyltransferase domain-containing protein [Streptosporangium soli]|nr:SAM-dependent methyltransferase [Streptosporangium sp. KLBMP 9127]
MTERSTDSPAALAARWRADLERWAIPAEIAANAPVNPWGHAVDRFARRTDASLARPGGPTFERVLAALPEGGTLLDVGAGTGAAGLPAAKDRRARLIAVDENAGMLARLGELSPEAVTIEGRWPDIADKVPVADVAMCAHVVFNVPDLAEFFAALTAHARRRVVVELPEEHPTSWAAPLWAHFHGVTRPVTPTARDAVDLAAAMGHDVDEETYPAPDDLFESVEELAGSACRRLCLDPARAAEVADAALVLGVWPLPPRRWTTMSWEVC